MTPSICLDPLYPSLLTEDKIPAGFRHVEFWGWRDKDIPAIEAACRKRDVHVVNFSGHRVGSPVADTARPILFADASDVMATASNFKYAGIAADFTWSFWKSRKNSTGGRCSSLSASSADRSDARLVTLEAPGSNPSPCRSGCYWLLGVAVGDGVAAGRGCSLRVNRRIFQASPSRT
jgi:hypothetical protein